MGGCFSPHSLYCCTHLRPLNEHYVLSRWTDSKCLSTNNILCVTCNKLTISVTRGPFLAFTLVIRTRSPAKHTPNATQSFLFVLPDHPLIDATHVLLTNNLLGASDWSRMPQSSTHCTMCVHCRGALPSLGTRLFRRARRVWYRDYALPAIFCRGMLPVWGSFLCCWCAVPYIL